MTPRRPSRTRRAKERAETSALIVATALKLLGGAIAFNELVLHYPDYRSGPLWVAAICLTGGNVSETVMLHVVDKFFEWLSGKSER